MPNIFIKKIQFKEITTRNGLAKKFLITDDTLKLYDGWCGKWNADWKEGQTLTIQDSQIKVRDWNGRQYTSIEAPPESRASFGGANTMQIQVVNDKVDVILTQNKNIMEMMSHVLTAIKNIPLAGGDTKVGQTKDFPPPPDFLQ